MEKAFFSSDSVTPLNVSVPRFWRLLRVIVLFIHCLTGANRRLEADKGADCSVMKGRINVLPARSHFRVDDMEGKESAVCVHVCVDLSTLGSIQI